MMRTSAMSGTLRQREGALGQDGRRHQLQHRVLGAADPDGARQRPAGPHDDAIHGLPVWPDHGDDPGHLASWRPGRPACASPC